MLFARQCGAGKSRGHPQHQSACKDGQSYQHWPKGQVRCDLGVFYPTTTSERAAPKSSPGAGFEPPWAVCLWPEESPFPMWEVPR